MEDENILFNSKHDIDDSKMKKINLSSSSCSTTNSMNAKLKEDSLENLDESQVEFKIYISVKQHQTDLDKEQNLDVNNTLVEDQQIDQLYEEMINYIESLTSNYIWNNERFYLNRPIRTSVQPEYSNSLEESAIGYTCYGCVDFGDNLEDEWFIVYLLYKLTSKFSGKLAAKISDFDGEFLLIHAANNLPEWASSAADNCMKNRVFIYNGELHLIPPATNPSQITYLPAYGSIKNSLHGAKIVFDFPGITKANFSIQDCIQKQISLFEPDVISKNMFHRATCLIPAKLAWLLKNNPALISSAINRFCEKDPKDLKLCSTLNTFKPVDLVNYRVLFTKHLYGKLKYSDYKPEKRQNWPVLSTLTENPNDHVLANLTKERSILGFKLTCAFEIISKQILSDQLEDKTFENYIRKLKNLGYFKDFIENSKNYNELMEKAKEGFLNETNNKYTEPKTNKQNNFDKYSNLIDSFYLDNIISEDYVVKLKEEITNIQEKETDDSDDWLCVEAPQLDDYLEMYSRGDVSSTYDFRIISNAFKSFMQRPTKTKKEDLLQGVDYKSIDKANDEKLIDFNVDSIEENLKDILKLDVNKKENNKNDKKNANKNIKSKNNQPDYDFDDNDDDESDSFYEIDDDLLDNDDLDDQESLKNYMSSMDAELKDETNLSRLNPKLDDLDIDLNLVSNALESYSSQLGFTGPVSNILKSLGL